MGIYITCLTKEKESLNYKDVTKQWLKPIIEPSKEVKKYKKGDTYIFRGNKYKVDSHFVKYSFDEGEDVFAKELSKIINKQITLIPKIEYPLGVKSPDFRIGNNYYDLKNVYGNDSDIIYQKIRGKEEQSNV